MGRQRTVDIVGNEYSFLTVITRSENYSTNKKWDVKIGKDGKYLYLGRYATFEEAVEVREAAEIEYFGFTKT